MLGLYIYTLINWSNTCNMLSILNKITLQKILQNFETNNVFLNKKVKTKQQQEEKNQTYKPLPEPGIEPGTSCTQSDCVNCAPPSQLRDSIVVKLFYCFDAMGRDANKQSRICATHF